MSVDLQCCCFSVGGIVLSKMHSNKPILFFL